MSAEAPDGPRQEGGTHANEADLPDFVQAWLDRRSGDGDGAPAAGAGHAEAEASSDGPPVGAPQ
eukprot:2369751-Lingulodinium_polyedra.AAC.1